MQAESSVWFNKGIESVARRMNVIALAPASAIRAAYGEHFTDEQIAAIKGAFEIEAASVRSSKIAEPEDDTNARIIAAPKT